MTSSYQPRMGKLCLAAAVAAGALSTSLLSTGPAHAEGPVSPSGKGIAGGALLGAEVVMITEGIIGVDKWWAYLLGGAAGAAGGAVGGFFLEDALGSSTSPAAEAPLYMLAGGMALIIPTVVVILNATAYKPEVEAEEGETEGGKEEPAATPEGPEGPAAPAAPATPGVEGGVKVETGARRYRPVSLIGLDAFKDMRLTLGLPAVHIRPSFTEREVATYGVAQDHELHFPLVAGRF